MINILRHEAQMPNKVYIFNFTNTQKKRIVCGLTTKDSEFVLNLEGRENPTK